MKNKNSSLDRNFVHQPDSPPYEFRASLISPKNRFFNDLWIEKLDGMPTRHRGCYILASAVAALAATAAPSAALAQESVVSACSGVRLPKSVVTDIAGQVLVPVIDPIESILNTLTFGGVNLNLTGALANAASGAPIKLSALDINGNAIDILANPECVTSSDAYTMTTPKGVSIGGNRIAGLGAANMEASAGDLDAVAIGNFATTSVGAAGAVAIGANATVTHSGSVALGANSLANGSTLGNAAYLTGGAATAEVNIGNRRLTGLAAGADATDAVNVAQLKIVNDAMVAMSDNVVTYDDGTKTSVTLAGVSGTRITNLAAGTIAASSSDAVNGSQLFATNAAVTQNTVNIASNTTNITTLSYDLSVLDALAVKYSDGTKNTVILAGAGGTRISNVADGIANDDAATVGQLKTLSDTVDTVQNDALLFDSVANAYNAKRGGVDQRITGVANGVAGNDAVNVDQLNAVAQTAGNSVQYDGATKDSVTFAGSTGTRLSNVSDGAVSMASSDAVNGSQLFTTNQAVTQVSQNVQTVATNVATHLGGGSTASSNGNVSAPSYALSTVNNVGQSTTSVYNNVGDALDGLSSSITNVNQRIDTIGSASERALLYDGPSGSPKDQVTLAGPNGTTITNLNAGAVNATSSDAVNGAQLHATNQQLAYNLTAITNLQDGKDGYLQVNNTAGKAKPVASGEGSLAAGAGAVSSGNHSAAFGTDAQALADNSVAIGTGSTADRVNSIALGYAGGERQVTFVAEGTAATDAVNVQQLQQSMGDTLTSANAYTDMRLSQIAFDIKDIRSEAEGGTASAMAVAGIPQTIEAGTGMLGFGVSTWQGERAMALGFSKASDNGKIVVRAAATMNTRSKGGANAGVGFAF